MLSNPNTFTDIFGLCLSNLSIACKLIGNSIPLKLRDSARFLKCFVIRSVVFNFPLCWIKSSCDTPFEALVISVLHIDDSLLAC